MRVLSIEEKAARYDLAIEAARCIYNNMKEGDDFSGIEDLEIIFPELTESKDEKIRKELLEHCKNQAKPYIETGNECPQIQSWITWLEKQGQKPQGKSALEAAKEIKIDNQNCIKPADKVEPKFKIEKGRWYVCIRDLDDDYGTRAFCKGSIYYSTKNETLLPGNSNIPFEMKYCANDYFRLWTIQDAKDGDVLQFKDRPFIYNGYLEEKKYPFAYGGVYVDGKFFVSNGLLPWSHSDVYPATKKQRELLFQKIKEAGYEWNAEKKEFKKIEQKPAEWTEEDTNMFGSIRSTLLMYMNNLSLPKEIRDIHKEELKWLDELYDRGLS